ncbi:MAG: ABC transporter ATP-binding protein, partial [Paracoccaceae bacterium]|nr:ABC transporter ATP-binding protein [Paracoccaceae bacterium]
DQAISFFDDDFAGRISQKQLQASRAISDTVNEFVNVISFAMASLVGSFLLLVSIDYRIAISLIVWLFCYVFLIRWFLPRIRKKSAKRAGARSMLSGQIVDTITNIRTVKLFAHYQHEDRAALDALENFRGKATEFGMVASSFRYFLMLLSGLLPVILVGGSLLLWSNGMTTTGDIAATGSVAIRIAQMSGWVSFVLMAIYSNVGEAEDGMRTLAHPHQLVDAPQAKEVVGLKGSIEFRKVSFRYGKEIGGVTNIDLQIKPGEHIGLVGESGAGKSTLVTLLMRLYDPEGGAIMIDGTDIRNITQESLRNQISMVTQETAMFNRSAWENIAYGNPKATRDEVVEASIKAQAHEFIINMKDRFGRKGYDAHLGERGVKLSGGQRQRIALARAVLKDAPIMVLDEATSALDSTVEGYIQDALRQIIVGKTVIAIAHRLSTILRMDRIVVMHEGNIVEQGTVDDLLDRGGVFSQHWEKQVGGFIGIDPDADSQISSNTG